MNVKALVRATAVGTMLQLVMVVTGHFIPAFQSTFMWGGLLISAIAGGIYSTMAGSSLGRDLTGGVFAGGVCAFVGILASYLMGDVPPMVLLFGSVSSAVTGGIGAFAMRYFR
jgi:hypothetical protein